MGTNTIPQVLKKGDEIRIVAPASVVKKEYIDKSIAALSASGYKVSLGKHILSGYNQFAGTDEERLSDFQEAVNDQNVKAIFCARGGYGSIRIIDQLNFSAFKTHPKWLVGFSDITVFHSFVNQNLNLASIHAPMPINSESSYYDKNMKQLNDLLQGEKRNIIIPYHALNRAGVCKGKILGGNLSILHNLQSTPFEIMTRNAILFIEDLGEQLYHLDRMLNNLLLSGKLESLKGLIVGGITEMKDKKRPFGKTAYQIIMDVVKKFDYPVAFHFPAGHIENNTPFLLGTQVELEVNEKGSVLKYL